MGEDPPKSDWYPDPEGSGRLRWWDGTRWTDRFHDDAGPPARPRRRSRRLLIGLVLLAALLGAGGALAAIVLVDPGSSREERIVFVGVDGESLRTVAADGSGYARVVAGLGTVDSWDLSADGDSVVFAASDEGGSTVYLADMSGEEQVTVGEGTSPVFSHDGARIAYSRESGAAGSGESAVYIYEVDSGEADKLGPGYPVEFTDSGDELLVYVPHGEEDDYRSDVGILDLSGRLRTIEDGFTPALSPDGRRFAFVRDEGGEESYEPAIFIAEAGREKAIRVAAGESPVFSPDGSMLAYVEEEGEEEESESVVRLLDVETGEDERLAEGFEPVFSPDGSQLLVSRSVEFGETYSVEQRLLDAVTGEDLQLVEGENPVFSESGGQIVYVRDLGDEDWEPMIHVAEVDSGAETPVTEGTSPAFYQGSSE